MRSSSRSSASGYADTASGNPFAVFEIIADAKIIQGSAPGGEIMDSARRIEQNADGMVKTILGTSDLSVCDVPANVIEQIIELLRTHRQ